MNEIEYTRLRREMIRYQLIGRGIKSPDILDAFLKVRRHIFIPQENRYRSYENNPVPIGFNQTISQPYIVAYMTELLKPDKDMRALEIGTGSGYQTAILSCLCKEVYSIEMIEQLSLRTGQILNEEGFYNIHLKTGDGYYGWKKFAPFDSIIVTCAPLIIPQHLTDQLSENGKIIIPAGERNQQKLYLIVKQKGKLIEIETIPVRFVPMIHKMEKNDSN